MNRLLKKICATLATIILIFQYNCVLGFSKSETVFSNVDLKGNVKSTVINNKLSLENGEYNSTVEDDSELESILNINGEETYTLKGNLLQWQTFSKDIYYQGQTENVLPITMDIKFYLNEKEVEPKEIEGKSGNIKIELKFKNNLENNVAINGKSRTLYTPFIVTVGTILSDEENSNISVTNGKTIDTGVNSIIAAIASPGLYESLDIEEFKDFDTISISFDTTNFKNSTTMYVIATPKLIEDADLSLFDKMDDLTKNIDDLQTNMDKIQDGANKLQESAKDLKEGTETLSSGATTLYKGTKTVNSGATKIESGSKTVAEGVSTISSNLEKIVSSIKELEKGAKELDKGLEQIILEIEKAQNAFTSKEAQESMTMLKTLKSQNTSTANTISSNYKKYNLDKLTIDQILELPYDNKTKANLITVKNNYESDLVTLLEGNATAIDSMTTQLNDISSQLKTLKEALEEAKSGSSQISGGLTQLKTGISKIYSGSVTLSSGADDLYEGASSLAKGTKDLSKGASDLSDGAKTLSDGTTTFETGVNDLSSGISTFNEEGIKKLSSYSDKLSEYSDVINELINLSKNYKGFACNNANVSTFVYVVKP